MRDEGRWLMNLGLWTSEMRVELYYLQQGKEDPDGKAALEVHLKMACQFLTTAIDVQAIYSREGLAGQPDAPWYLLATQALDAWRQQSGRFDITLNSLLAACQEFQQSIVPDSPHISMIADYFEQVEAAADRMPRGEYSTGGGLTCFSLAAVS